MLNSCKRWIGHFFALFTQAKSFRDNPLIGNRLLNRMGLHVIRIVIAHGFFWLRQQLLFYLVTTEERQQLRRQGFLVVPNCLSPEQLELLNKDFKRCMVDNTTTNNNIADTNTVGHSIKSTQGDTSSLSCLLTPAVQNQLAATASTVNQAAILNRLRYASGTFLSPWFYFLRIARSGKINSADPQKTPHADAFHPTMKAWLFLNDVDADNGPFCYFPGSHRLTLKRLRWEYRQSLSAKTSSNFYTSRGSFRLAKADQSALELAPIKSFAVPANTLIIANTYGFHCRGQAQANAQRDSLWASAWRMPFIPVPLPDGAAIRQFFYSKMQKKLAP
jgi:hypothetical protein